MEGDLKDHLIQPSWQKHGHDHQQLVQMDLKRVQHWEIHHIPGVTFSRADCSPYDRCSFAVQWNLPRSNLYPLPLVFSL